MKGTGNLILLTARQKKNGKFPLKVRIVYQRRYKDYKTGIDLSLEDFNQASQPRPSKEYRAMHSDLNALKVKVDTIIAQCQPVTFQKFENAFYQRLKEASDLYSLFQTYIDSLNSEGRIKTAVSYTTAMNSLKKFKNRLSLYDVNADLLKKYHQKLIEEGRSPTTIGIYVRSLRTIYNYAISQGIIKRDEQYPFGRHKYIIPASRNIKKALKLEDIKKIYKFKPQPGTLEDRSKDFWLFSYYCNGINFKDIAMLKRKNIDGTMLRFIREKTKRSSQGNQLTIACYITEDVFEIIRKWGNQNAAPDSYLFNILEEKDSPIVQQRKIDQLIQTTNKNMKRICNKIGLDIKITTYSSRHSAATILKRSGASIEQIQEALGHSNVSVTQKYHDSFEDETKKELAKALTLQ
jgi:site-specific recombinase XerD